MHKKTTISLIPLCLSKPPITNPQKFIVSLNTIIIPTTVSRLCQKGMERCYGGKEMRALEKNKTWEIVDRPNGKNIVDCKWIFTLNIRLMDHLKGIKQDW
ncbi:hypothetical protein HPP92_009144 [Vanilla planifolia]|uniref:Uncharacterized protein n=1 Tax=Vanilla planifolia TaxID=51239 RepID=A0A835RDQ6_VANPL|nr:hypothetical protein HPP92_009144 [Vanilla planifolia]